MSKTEHFTNIFFTLLGSAVVIALFALAGYMVYFNYQEKPESNATSSYFYEDKDSNSRCTLVGRTVVCYKNSVSHRQSGKDY